MSLQADPASLPRLLSGMPVDGAMGLAEHLAIHGEMPFAGRRERRGAGALIDLAEQAGLLGRGGGAFPAATKMRAVADARGRPIVLANVAEGEPASHKDCVLMEGLPHLVLDGGVLAARAVGADELILCIDESGEAALESATCAIYERERAGGDALKVSVQVVPAGYVSGQESALVNLCNGGQALPALTPPMPFTRGVRRRPTLINNAETLAHLALIARYGSQWFRALGTQAHTGSTLLTLSGAVTYPGVYEIEQGAPLASLIEAAGGTTGQIRAVLLGGYAGTWLDKGSISTLELSNDRLAPHAASLGAGIIVLLSGEACPVAETARVASWLAAQSSGQCGPCVHGLRAIAGAIEQLAAGSASAGTGQRIARWSSQVFGRGACAHPDGVLSFLTSALDVFAEEFADHARHGPCDACSRPGELPLPVPARLATAA
ncbi:MAG: NADH-ubiquinone oxidoreductase-F iron-sulfur binding region domain-containing protein [Solirubrobacterales bacterium]